MADGTRLTEAAVRELAASWFAGLNDKWPVVRMITMLAADGLEMHFPDADIANLEDFERWYRGVGQAFFDQDHLLQRLEVDLGEGGADLRVEVLWQARSWSPPAAQSEAVAMLAQQRWKVTTGPAGRPLISGYWVDRLEPYQEPK